MRTILKNKLPLIVVTSILLSSCSQKSNNFDIDLSNLPRPKKNEKPNQDTQILLKTENKVLIKVLVSYKDRAQILSAFEFGKKDPFSKSENQLNTFSSDLKITGFLNTEVKKYVFVNYLGNEGTISGDSIGGENTNLLPKGARVINIDTKSLELIIDYKDENIIFEL